MRKEYQLRINDASRVAQIYLKVTSKVGSMLGYKFMLIGESGSVVEVESDDSYHCCCDDKIKVMKCV
ncbi:unnamed protein product [Onchocerca flexuosa]|uniref:Phage protein n=1 Tax=Onchocerca flexuosa TaxID=387005 RepID=A0A183HI02_9BILA|nr:unnamed protein product [Onchocerca flexuosa]